MESEPFQAITFSNITVHPISMSIIIYFIIMILLLIASALISGSEVAFFSLSPKSLSKLKKSKVATDSLVLELLDKPKRLLATILIGNNFVNVGIVILSTFITLSIFDFSASPTVGFIFQVIIVTFLLLLFGEIIPKVYATKYALSFAQFMVYPILFMGKIFRPISSFLIYSTSIVNKRIERKSKNISIDDLSHALDLTSEELEDDKKILKGIVKFGNIEVKKIMKSRVDIVAVDISTEYKSLISTIIDSGYSRIPIYEENFDDIKGILYIKDLLPHLDKKDDFQWSKLIRTPYFVPETKKISDLLEEFQEKKIHLAIVIDEYGGTSGIITLEDIIEEIVGEISDEFDEDETQFSKIDANSFLFEGKTLLNDFYKIIETEDDIFDDVKGDADTLAGLILEIKGEIPKQHEVINYKNYEFKIKAADNRRIKQIIVKINPEKKSEGNNKNQKA